MAEQHLPGPTRHDTQVDAHAPEPDAAQATASGAARRSQSPAPSAGAGAATDPPPGSVSAALARRLRADIEEAGGWIGFDRFMQQALYAPGLGYYARGDTPFGHWPQGPRSAVGSDFVTAPELSPWFARALAVQVAQALQAAQADEVWEFGAGSGALAAALLPALDALGCPVRRYTVIEVSGSLRAQQQARLAAFGERVRWVDTLPPALVGVALGNEVLDAMPAQLLAFDGRDWSERGVAWHDDRFVFADRPTALRPPDGCGPFLPGTQVEIQPQAGAFIATLAEHLTRGLALFIDYGFPQDEFYLPQRLGGTLMCHRAHRADADPLVDVGLKDITVHVDFSAIALAAQAAGLDVAGYTSQARFLVNCGIVPMLQQADARERVDALKLLNEHEMGELFKVIALSREIDLDLVGFCQGDRTHRL
jgi:SAM-dependent MidA family methyltransferase